MNWIKPLLASTLIACSLNPSVAHTTEMNLPTDISQKDKPATIKVLISRHKDAILLEAKGRYMVYNPLTTLELSKGFKGKRDYVTTNELGISWNGQFPGIQQIRIVPSDAQSTLLVDGIEYRGCIEIYEINGKLNVVNEVDVERYLKATLTTQFNNELDSDVMDALAIVSRTNAYYLVSRRPDAYWHVDAQEVSYLGYATTLQNIPVEEAINNTRYLVLTYNNVPFATTWTEDSAGKTADFSTIFRKESSTPKGTEAPFAARDREKHAWSFAISKQELAKAIAIDKVTAVDIYQDKHSQKVYAVRINDTKESHTMDFFKLQKALGKNRLRSNDFTVDSTGDKIVFKGYGEGAGVGLCVYSATLMAEHGDTTQKILSAFYPDTKLENIRSFK